jgi:hypothetical protein
VKMEILVLNEFLIKGFVMDDEIEQNGQNIGEEIPLVRGGTEGDGVFSTKAKFAQYSQLPYNPKLKEKAKKLRKAGVLAEVLFWKQAIIRFGF